MAKFNINWGFNKKPEKINYEVQHLPKSYFREKIRLTIEIEAEYPVDSNFYDELASKGGITFRVPEDVTINSTELVQMQVLAQATKSK